MELHNGLFIGGGRIDAQGQSARQINLFAVEVRRRVSRAGQGTSAVGIEEQGNASREATFKTAVQATAEAGENFSRPGGSFCERAHSTHNERHSHRGTKALPADVAEDDECRSG